MCMTGHSVVGTIRIEPALNQATACEDATLDLLLLSLTRCQELGIGRPSDGMGALVARRWNWRAAGAGAGVVRADIGRLIRELDSELEQLAGAAG
jgi:hypothetical protein